MKKCPKCGAGIDKNAHFCIYCMAILIEKEAVKIKKIQNLKRLYATISVVISITILFVSISFIPKNNTNVLDTDSTANNTPNIFIASNSQKESVISKNNSQTSGINSQPSQNKGHTSSGKLSNTESSNNSSSDFAPSIYTPNTQKQYVHNNIKYSIVSDCIIIEGVTPNFSGALNIPSKIGSYPVCKIEVQAFSNNKKITSVAIPGSVTVISEAAFCNCSNLKSIKLAEGIKCIEYGAFCDTDISLVTLPKSLTEICGESFSYCDKLKHFEFPDKIEKINMWVFKNNESLVSVTIPKSITEIEEAAFIGSPNLKNVYYRGSKEDRDKIKINTKDNDYLLNATWHYNYTD